MMQATPADPSASAASFFGERAATFGQADASRRFEHFGQSLVAAADLPPAAHVLDVATGRGAVLFPAADRVGSRGRAVGVDLAPSMVQATELERRQRGLQNVEVLVMNAERLSFPDASFDAVLCGFGLMFLSQLDVGLGEFRRVLRPGGVLAASTWAPPDPLYAWFSEVQNEYGIRSGAGSLMTHRLNAPADLATVLRDAAFIDVDVRSEYYEFVYENEEQWWARNFQRPLDPLAPDQLERMKAEVFSRLKRLKTPDGFPQRTEALFGVGRKPGS